MAPEIEATDVDEAVARLEAELVSLYESAGKTIPPATLARAIEAKRMDLEARKVANAT